MTSSLQIYESIVHTGYFKNTSFVLFLNKKDLYHESLAHTNLNAAFSDYSGHFNFDTSQTVQ